MHNTYSYIEMRDECDTQDSTDTVNIQCILRNVKLNDIVSYFSFFVRFVKIIF